VPDFPDPGIYSFSGDCKCDDDPAFHIFKCELYYALLSAILQSIKPAMTTPVVNVVQMDISVR
jgi:hypothetical protein